jgi:hypothetical protein
MPGTLTAPSATNERRLKTRYPPRFDCVQPTSAGIALLGTVTATLASWLVERVSEQAEDEQAATPARRYWCGST